MPSTVGRFSNLDIFVALCWKAKGRGDDKGWVVGRLKPLAEEFNLTKDDLLSLIAIFEKQGVGVAGEVGTDDRRVRRLFRPSPESLVNQESAPAPPAAPLGVPTGSQGPAAERGKVIDHNSIGNRTHRFIRWWTDEFPKHHKGERARITGIEAGAAKQLMQQFRPDESKKLADAVVHAWTSGDHFWQRRSITIRGMAAIAQDVVVSMATGGLKKKGNKPSLGDLGILQRKKGQ